MHYISSRVITICKDILVYYVIHYFLFQETKSAGAQALQNVVMLADLISHTLETDGNESTSFSQSGESISK